MKQEELKQQAYYNKVSSEYDSHYASEGALLYRVKLYENFLKGTDLANKKVLDAMCGGGQNTVFFSSRGAQVMGVDISQGQCQNYKSRFPSNEVVCASILNTNLPDESFDIIVTESLHHVHPYVGKCMDEFYRMLKPNGLLIFWEPSSGSIFDYLRKLWYRLDSKYFEDNEASIDLSRLQKDYASRFSLEKKKYGGNLGYIFLNITMVLRISQQKSKWLQKALVKLELLLMATQSRWNSLWFMAQFRKKM